MLSNKEIEKCNDVINALTAGTYELKDMFGDDWNTVASPTSFGKRFKQSVLNGKFKKVSLIKIKTNNHNLYKVR